MIIREMFADDINRKVNGVIKVDQDATDVIEQEVREYVITKELKKHFITFFNYYGDAFHTPTADMGVWISGFFGSGKSHFLKMLSYILQNKEVGGVKTVELFRKKFEDDPATFMLIDNATKGPTETILFNIDIEGSINKDKTAVLRVFAKMFYNHLGFYGENLKVAMLEKYIEQSGKTEEFRRVFEQKKGKSWLDQRKAFAFNGKYIVPTLMEVLGMSEEDAKNWFNDKSAVEFSIAQLVDDIKAYVNSKPKDFRLLFMIDEAGQYVGTDTDMLLNLQSLTEKIGSECDGKVWVVCTGQEAIDEIIKVRADEFSRIQARFKTRLSLTSSSVDEVIQKRILKKKNEVTPKLTRLYDENDSVLRNLFSFTDSILDIKGYSGPQEFAENYPFVPYQFIIMQKVFSEIRKHGNAGKHFSGGERSMLSGFQEAAQKVQEKDEYTLVPFFHFYDTVHTFLDGSIRRVIERCQKAADSGAGIEQYDVDVLKLLYLVRYVDDIKATLDNLVILMADDIRTDKIVLREAVRNSLDRLMSQNYIGRTGDTYNFLTDEEQDIQREIKSTPVDTASIVERIAQMIYGDIFTTKKYHYGKYDFDFDKMVDGVTSGSVTGGMKLRFLTVATDAVEKNEMRLMTESVGQAIAVLSETPYYESLESAMKIRKYVKQRNVAQLPKSVQDIIRDQQDEANAYDATAMTALRKAIETAEFYVDGEHLTIKGSDAKAKIEQALEYLVAHVYGDLDLITKNAESDDDIVEVLTGGGQARLDGFTHNQDAAAKVEEYLEMQFRKNLPTSMADIQSRYQAIPYGWREIDVAAVVALLIHDQKVTVKYAGNTIQPGNTKLPDMLRKKTEIGDTRVFVIISDALRYEVAASLAEQLRRETQSQVELNSMCGIYPTITPYGMAALLPHKELTVGEKAGGSLSVLADGQPTDSLNREKVLKAENLSSVALQYKNIIGMKKAERTALVKGMDVVYIYHDKIDEASHTSDNAVFPACDEAIEEIKNLVRIIVNEFSGTRIFITADHGFLYTYSPLTEDDKVSKSSWNGQEVEYGRRYAIMQKGAQPEYLQPVQFLGGKTDYDAFAPKENVRIKMSGGGLNFVHGGISLQEMVVPVIDYHYLRTDSKTYQRNRDKIDTKPVTVSLYSASRKISNMIFSLNFYQKEAVGANREKAVYSLYFTDSTGKVVSDTAKIIADKTSENSQERTFRCSFNLKSLQFDSKETYYLGKYKVITLCGSTRFKDEFLEAQKRLTLDGNIVISVGLFGHSGDDEVWTEGTKEMLDDMHKRKIDMADEIFVINVGGYIGSSTRSEIEYAQATGKTVRYLEAVN